MDDHNYAKKKKYKNYKKCCVPGCDNLKSQSNILHEFPKNVKLCKSWIDKCRIGLKITRNVLVCSEHFVAADYKSGKTCE